MDLLELLEGLGLICFSFLWRKENFLLKNRKTQVNILNKVLPGPRLTREMKRKCIVVNSLDVERN